MEEIPKTLNEVLKKTEYSQKQALFYRNNKKTKISWNFVIRSSLDCAFALIGIKGERTLQSLPCAIICMENCQESFEICYGCHFSGIIPIFVSPKFTYEQIQQIIDENNTLICFIDNSQKYKFERIEDTSIHRIIVDIQHSSNHHFRSYLDFVYPQSTHSDEEIELKRTQINEIANEIQPDDICEIVYCPKEDGRLHQIFWTHKNILTECIYLKRHFSFSQKERYVHYFPNYFFIERIFVFYLGLICQFSIYIGTSEMIRSKGIDLFHLMKQVKPTIFLGVPRIYEKLISNLRQFKGRRKRWSKKKIFASTMRELEGGKKIKRIHMAKSIQKKPKKELGIISIQYYFNAISPLERSVNCELLSYGIVVNDGLCLPETTGYCTINRKENYLVDTLGISINPTVSITIENNQIVVEGPIVTRNILHQEEEHDNLEMIFRPTDENYVMTQYQGEFEIRNDHYYLKRIGTTLPMITTSTGQFFYPLPVEKQLNEMKTITASLIVGNGKKFLACLLFTNMNLVEEELKENTPTRQNLSKDPYYANFLRKQLEQINMKLSREVHLKRFVVIVDSTQTSLFTTQEERDLLLEQYNEYYTMIYRYQ